jgi:MoaA/NifB/PqqE/SkfB family radical SAM enzyme
MRYYLSPGHALKRLENPVVYNIARDELYELDEEAFACLTACTGKDGGEVSDGEFLDFCLAENILTAGKQAQVTGRYILGEAPSPSLRYLELQVTRRCNLRCRHCYLGPGRAVDLSVAEVKSVLQEFERMQGLRVLVTGGEPVLHPRFGELNDLLARLSLRIVLFTNGSIVNRIPSGALNVHEVQVSLDGLEQAHDALRGPGSYRQAVRAIEEARAEGLDVSVSTMVHARNRGDFDPLERMLRDLEVRDWTVDVPCVTGTLLDHPEFRISPEDAGRFLKYGFGETLHGGGEGYACGLHLMSVGAGGACAKCAFYEERPVGHISEGLQTCWERVRPVPLGELACDCRALDVCRGCCRFRAELLGSPLGKDFYRCRAYDTMDIKSSRKEVRG